MPPPPPPLPDAAATAAACAWTAGLIDLSQIPTRPFLTKRFPDRYSLTWCDSLGEDRAACRRSYAVMKDGTVRRCVYHALGGTASRGSRLEWSHGAAL